MTGSDSRDCGFFFNLPTLNLDPILDMTDLVVDSTPLTKFLYST